MMTDEFSEIESIVRLPAFNDDELFKKCLKRILTYHYIQKYCNYKSVS